MWPFGRVSSVSFRRWLRCLSAGIYRLRRACDFSGTWPTRFRLPRSGKRCVLMRFRPRWCFTPYSINGSSVSLPTALSRARSLSSQLKGPRGSLPPYGCLRGLPTIRPLARSSRCSGQGFLLLSRRAIFSPLCFFRFRGVWRIGSVCVRSACVLLWD